MAEQERLEFIKQTVRKYAYTVVVSYEDAKFLLDHYHWLGIDPREDSWYTGVVES